MGTPDPRMPALKIVLEVELGEHGKALDEAIERSCWEEKVAGEEIAVFW
jgi:hypothetical protein